MLGVGGTVASFNPDGLEIYPEYLADLAIFLCPSDLEAGDSFEELGWKDANGQFVTYTTPGVPGGTGFNTSGDASYVYFGLAVEGDNRLFQGWTGGDPVPGSPGLSGAGWAGELLVAMLIWKNSTTDDDLSYSIAGANASSPTGGALGISVTPTNPNTDLTGTALRLREGIERFFITDINNAAGSALGQSNLPVMWDSISTDPMDTAHIPGGSNVLYADGHVEFIKYDGTPDSSSFPSREWAEITEIGA